LSNRQRYGAFDEEPSDVLPDHIANERDTDEVVVNRCRSIVRAYTSFVGRMPVFNVPPSGDTEEDMKRAEAFERAIYGLADLWVMPRRMANIGFYRGLLGTAVGVVWPDDRLEVPMLKIRSPRGFYCVPKDEDGYELAVAIFAAKYPGKQVANMYGLKKFDTTDEVEVVQYYDDKEIVTIAGGQRVSKFSGRHGMPFCPVITVNGADVPGSPYGESAIVLAVKLQQYYNYIRSMQLAAAEEQFNQPLVLPNGAVWPKGLPHGSRDVIELPPEATGHAAYRVPPPAMPFDIHRLADDVSKELNAVTDIPVQLSAGTESPYESGSAFNAKLGPIQALMRVEIDNIYPAIRRLIAMAFTMMERRWPDKEYRLSGTLPVYGRNEKRPFVQSFKVGDFGGDYNVLIMADPAEYFDEQTRWVQGLQAVQNQVLSKETLMQYNPFIKPGTLEMEKLRIKREVEENVKQTLAAQQMAASVSTTNAPMNEPGKTAYSLEQGFLGEMEAAPMPGGAEVSGEVAAPAGNPLIEQMAALVRAIPRIKGRVFLVGDFLDEQYLEEASGEGSAPVVELALTDMNDKATILNAVKARVPEVHGNMTFNKVVDEPDEPFIEVTPGTTGTEIQNAELGGESAIPEDIVGEEQGEVPLA